MLGSPVQHLRPAAFELFTHAALQRTQLRREDEVGSRDVDMRESVAIDQHVDAEQATYLRRI
eukprot:659882-Alexandrium_andersonii.AAC.1